MTSLVSLQDAVVANLATIPGVVTCEPYAGQFGTDHVSRVTFTAPAIFVSILGADPDRDPGTDQVDLNVRLAAYVIATHATDRQQRERDAIALVESVLLQVRLNQWGLSGVSAAAISSVQNLYTTVADDLTVALWAVNWQQIITLGTSVWDGTGVLPQQVYVGYSPFVGATYIADYLEVTNVPTGL